jgi:hypothetical protein
MIEITGTDLDRETLRQLYPTMPEENMLQYLVHMRIETINHHGFPIACNVSGCFNYNRASTYCNKYGDIEDCKKSHELSFVGNCYWEFKENGVSIPNIELWSDVFYELKLFIEKRDKLRTAIK